MGAITDTKIQELIIKSRLEVTYKFEVPPKWLEIVNDEDLECSTFGTYGNFSTIIAPPKVGKTTLVSIPIASHITKKRIAGFQAYVPEGKQNVLWIDTEQGRGEAVKTLKSICDFSEIGHEKHPDRLFYHTLREYGYVNRVEITDYLIQHTPNLGVVVIDGIRDLINSINDEREATSIASNLLRWSEEKNIHIVTILHQNKGDGNARGHLGTELMNKAETVINLSKEIHENERQTIVEPKYNRHKEFRKFAIVIRNNIPLIVGTSEYIPENPKVNQLTHIQISAILNAVYKNDTYLQYEKLWQALRFQLMEIYKIDFGTNKCKQLLSKLKNDHYLTYDNDLRIYRNNASSLIVG